jgi:hypothetical protein
MLPILISAKFLLQNYNILNKNEPDFVELQKANVTKHQIIS